MNHTRWNTRPQIITWIGGVLLLIFALTSIPLLFAASPANSASRTAMISVAVFPRPSSEVIRVEGIVLSISEKIEVPAEMIGKLDRVAVTDGEIVAQGAELATIDRREAENRVEGAEIAMRKIEVGSDSTIDADYARKAMEVAEAELRRAEEANERVSNTYTPTEIERLQLVVERTKLEIDREEFRDKIEAIELDAKKNDLALSRLQLERHRIAAPIDGMIVMINRRAGEWVEVGMSVFQIVRVDRLRAEGFVSAIDAARLKRGSAVTFVADLDGLSNEQFNGRITFISPESNPINDQVKFWAEIDNTQSRLRPGLQGTLTVNLE